MIPRQEFKDKLTTELLNIGHYNLHTSTCLSLFSKDIKVEQSFSYSGSLFYKLTSLNINEHCLYDCLILGNFKFLLLFLEQCITYVIHLGSSPGQVDFLAGQVNLHVKLTCRGPGKSTSNKIITPCRSRLPLGVICLFIVT